MATMPKDAQDLFDNLVPEGLKQYPDKARELNAIYCFKITGDGGGEWTVDTTANPPSCTKGDSGKAQCTVEVAQRRLQDHAQPTPTPACSSTSRASSASRVIRCSR